MRSITLSTTLVAVALLGWACATTLRQPPPTSAQSGAAFTHAASSQDELLDHWLQALAANDEEALHRLRVTHDEYVGVIVPWTVEPGQPPRQVSEQPREFFWTVLDTKSRDLARGMLKEHGGKVYTRTRVEFTRPPREYAGYKAYGLVRLDVTTEDGSPTTVNGPWIAEVGGKYKFIGLDWTD